MKTVTVSFVYYKKGYTASEPYAKGDTKGSEGPYEDHQEASIINLSNVQLPTDAA
jgi:hypothetical protein